MAEHPLARVREPQAQVTAARDRKPPTPKKATMCAGMRDAA
jgi:hypothetical protein